MTGSAARRGLFALALVAAPVVVYALGRLDGPFAFDDREAIVDNASLAPGATLAELLWPPADTPVAGRPVVNLSFAASRALGGLDPLGFRVFNLALHALTGLLVFALLARTLRSTAFGEGVRGAADTLAFAAALLWSVHPLLSETVLYASQRSELWFGFFYVATLYALARAAAGAEEGARSRGWAALAALACALGTLSKEAMVTAPVLALLYDRTFLAGTFREAWRRRRGLHLGLFATWTIVAALLVAAPRARSIGFHAERGSAGNALDYLLAQGELLPHYLRLVIVPAPLVFDYGTLRPVALDAVLATKVAVVALLGVATLVALVRRPVLGFVGAAFFVVLAPTSSFVPIVTEVGAERRMYLPAVALVALVVVATARALAVDPRGRRLAPALLVVACAGLAYGTVRRAADYASRVSIWTTVVERRPRNARGHFNLGVALTDERRPREALASYERAVDLRPDYAEAHDNLASTLAMLGRFDEALAHHRHAIELWPGEARPIANLALTQFAAGRPTEALATIDRSLELDATSADAHQTRALALKALQRLPEAEAELREALRLDPEHAHAQYNLARMLLARGAPEAPEAASRAAALLPDDPDAELLASRALLGAGRAAEGYAHAARALDLLRAAGRPVGDAARELVEVARAAGLPAVAQRIAELAR